MTLDFTLVVNNDLQFKSTIGHEIKSIVKATTWMVNYDKLLIALQINI